MAVRALGRTEERQDGPTPHGGAYAIARFTDDAGNPTTKDQATQVEICEYDQAGECIFHTYGRLPRPVL